MNSTGFHTSNAFAFSPGGLTQLKERQGLGKWNLMYTVIIQYGLVSVSKVITHFFGFSYTTCRFSDCMSSHFW